MSSRDFLMILSIILCAFQLHIYKNGLRTNLNEILFVLSQLFILIVNRLMGYHG